MLKMFSDNIVFWDTEFSSSDPYKAEIISVGMVKKSGEELYLELKVPEYTSDWVKKVVSPLLTDRKISREEARVEIDKFLGDDKPYLMADWDKFDTTFLYKLYDIKENNPKEMKWNWNSVDFRSVLFALGIDPSRMSTTHENNLYQELGVNYKGYREHHALDDAKLLREVYLALEKRENK
ncbi:MAG TPA: 3'-5' exoribonuclease [Candidatus Paceibacterota bacterium]